MITKTIYDSEKQNWRGRFYEALQRSDLTYDVLVTASNSTLVYTTGQTETLPEEETTLVPLTKSCDCDCDKASST